MSKQKQAVARPGRSLHHQSNRGQRAPLTHQGPAVNRPVPTLLTQLPAAGTSAQRQAALLQLQRDYGNHHVQRLLGRRLQREPADTATATESEQAPATDEAEGWLESVFNGGAAALDGVLAVIDSAADTFSEMVGGFWSEEETVAEETPVETEPAESEPLEAGAAALQAALAQGERDQYKLTDIVFYARYPDRQGKPIDPKTEKDIVALWRGILNDEVKPALAGPVPEGPAGETPVAAPVGAQPDAGELAPLLDQLKSQEPIQGIEEIVSSLTEIQANVDSQTAEDKSLWNKKVWKAIEDTSLYKLYKEGSDAQYDEMTTLLGSARELVNGLTTAALQAVVPEITDTQTAQIIGYYHQQLNTLTPFFTQQANMNILHKGSSDAWKRTCNVTSLSMVLLSLGVGADAFNGDKDLLVKIANHLEPSLSSWDNLMALRMPDFVQFVAVLTEYKDGPEEGFGDRVNAARDTVAPKVSTTLNIFTAIVKYFGVNRVHSAEIDSEGTAKRKNKDLPADKQLDPSSFKTETFKADVLREVTPWINQGGQIVVNRPGHYLRLQSVDDSGVTLDDPGDEGKNYHVTWAESNSIGHFRSWQVFKKA